MKCETCHTRVATVHVTEMAGDDNPETDLCIECAAQQGLITEPRVFSCPQCGQAFKVSWHLGTDGLEVTCPGCGQTVRFISHSRPS